MLITKVLNSIRALVEEERRRILREAEVPHAQRCQDNYEANRIVREATLVR